MVHGPPNLTYKSTTMIKVAVFTFCGFIPESYDTACSAADIARLKSDRGPISYLGPDLVKTLSAITV